MRRNVAITFLVFMTMLAAGCGALTPTEKTDLEQNQSSVDEPITLAGISLGDSTDEVEQILGEDYRRETLHADGSWYGEKTACWYYGGDNIEIVIGEESGTVLQINVYGEYATPVGDQVGDKADQVLPAYEEKYRLAKDHFEENDLPGWFVVEEGQWLIFNFKDDGTLLNRSIAPDDKVESIHLVYEKFMH